MSEEVTGGSPAGRPAKISTPEPEAHAYTDGASTGSRGPGGYGVIVT